MLQVLIVVQVCIPVAGAQFNIIRENKAKARLFLESYLIKSIDFCGLKG